MTAAILDRDALLLAIRVDPHDDLPRHAYADWLEENGDAAGRAYAALVRVQMDYQRAVDVGRHPGVLRGLVLSWAKLLPADYFGGWLPEGLKPFDISIWHPRKEVESKEVVGFPVTRRASLSMQRGFACHAEMTCEQFMEHAEWLFERHPIESVTLSDRAAPSYWICGTIDVGGPAGHELPPALFGSLRGEVVLISGVQIHNIPPSETGPALSSACVAYGRELAGLPALGEK